MSYHNVDIRKGRNTEYDGIRNGWIDGIIQSDRIDYVDQKYTVQW